MANSIDWGKAAIKNAINWGKARFVSSIIEPNAYGWGGSYEKSYRGETNIVGVGQEMQKNNYYVYVLEQEGGNYLRDRIDGEFWLEDGERYLAFWEGTVFGKPTTGKSFYGTSNTRWVSIRANGSLSWWGCGFHTRSQLSIGFSSSYNLHIALKSQDDNIFTIKVYGKNGSFASIIVGAEGGSQPYTFNRNGEWQSLIIPYTELTGLQTHGYLPAQSSYFTIEGATNSSPSFNFGLEIDAVYWYNTLGEY